MPGNGVSEPCMLVNAGVGSSLSFVESTGTPDAGGLRGQVTVYDPSLTTAPMPHAHHQQHTTMRRRLFGNTEEGVDSPQQAGTPQEGSIYDT